MRAVLLIVAFAALFVICQGGGFNKCNVANCAMCQDVRTKCRYCADGYVAQGRKNCVKNSAYNCPAAAGPNCVSCSPPSPGNVAGCQKDWNATWGCTQCEKAYTLTKSTTPLPSGTKKKCGSKYVRTCGPQGGNSVLLGRVTAVEEN